MTRSSPETASQARPVPSRRLRLSLRLRLTLMFVAVFGVIQVTAAIVRLLYIRETSRSMFDQRMATRVEAIVQRLSAARPPVTSEQLREMAAQESREVFFDGLVISVYDNGRRLAATSAEPAIDFDAAGCADAYGSNAPVIRTVAVPALGEAADADNQARTVCQGFYTANYDRYVVAVATRDALVSFLATQMGWQMVVATPIGLVAVAVAGWLIAGLAVRPIMRLSEIARQMAPENLTGKIDVGSTAVELQRLQTELNDARQRLDAGFQAQERFIANVSHELNTPLATILAEAEVQRRDVAMSADGIRFIDSVQEEMRRLGRLVQSFLVLTRVRHGKPVPANIEAYPANELVMDSVQNCRRLAEQYAVHLCPSLAFDEESDLCVCGDPVLLRTMVDNLVFNAIRFSPRGQTVEIAVKAESDNITINVCDHGPGLPPELIPHVFDRFAQAKGEETLGRGSGLGLEIAQGIAELHGGSISAANNESGDGCCFSVRIPLYRPTVA